MRDELDMLLFDANSNHGNGTARNVQIVLMQFIDEGFFLTDESGPVYAMQEFMYKNHLEAAKTWRGLHDAYPDMVYIPRKDYPFPGGWWFFGGQDEDENMIGGGSRSARRSRRGGRK